MSTPKDGYYMARVQLDTGGEWTLYVRVKDGKQITTLGVELLHDACSEFKEVTLGQMVRAWPEDAAMELEALRTANVGLVERLRRLEEAGDLVATWAPADRVSIWNQAKGQP